MAGLVPASGETWHGRKSGDGRTDCGVRHRAPRCPAHERHGFHAIHRVAMVQASDWCSQCEAAQALKAETKRDFGRRASRCGMKNSDADVGDRHIVASALGRPSQSLPSPFFCPPFFCQSLSRHFFALFGYHPKFCVCRAVRVIAQGCDKEQFPSPDTCGNHAIL